MMSKAINYNYIINDAIKTNSIKHVCTLETTFGKRIFAYVVAR